MLPCLPHYSGSSVGVREATACLSLIPQPELLYFTGHSKHHIIPLRETVEVRRELMSSRRCLMSDE